MLIQYIGIMVQIFRQSLLEDIQSVVHLVVHMKNARNGVVRNVKKKRELMKEIQIQCTF